MKKGIHKHFNNLKEKERLANHTTLKIGGEAEFFYEAKDAKDLSSAIKIARNIGIPYRLIGGGSNVIVADDGLAGLVIKISGGNFKSAGSEMVDVEAGFSLAGLMNKVSPLGFSGLEWAAGIPGTVGGAIVGNAGSFGESISDIIELVEIYNPEKDEFLKIPKSQCDFNYRDSIFKRNDLVVLGVGLRLRKDDPLKISEKVKNNLKYKKEKHPIGFSAGSAFKNIEKDKFKSAIDLPQGVLLSFDRVPVGFLIEECGLKGHKIGGAMISDKHANFILNAKNASAADIAALISLIKEKIKEKYGVVLEEEIRYIK